MDSKEQISLIQSIFVTLLLISIGLLALMLSGCTQQTAFPDEYYVDFVNDFHLGSMGMANADKNLFTIEELNTIPTDEEMKYHEESDFSINYGKYIKDFMQYRLHIKPFVEIKSDDVHNFTINQDKKLKVKITNLLNQNIDGKLRIKVINRLLYSEEYPPNMEYSLLPKETKTIEIPLSTASLGNKEIEIQAKTNIELGRMVEKEVEIEVVGVNLKWIRELVFDKTEIFSSQPFDYNYAVQPIVQTSYVSQPTIKLNQTTYTIPRTNADKLKDYLFYALLSAVIIIAMLLMYFIKESKLILLIIAVFAVLGIMGFSYYGLSAQQSAIGTEDYITYFKNGDLVQPFTTIPVENGCAKQNDMFVLTSQSSSACGVESVSTAHVYGAGLSDVGTYFNGNLWLKKDFSGYDIYVDTYGTASYCGCSGGTLKVEVSRLNPMKGICNNNKEVDCSLYGTDFIHDTKYANLNRNAQLDLQNQYSYPWRQQEVVSLIPKNAVVLDHPWINEIKYRIPYETCKFDNPSDVLAGQTFNQPVDIHSLRFEGKLCTNVPSIVVKETGSDTTDEINQILIRAEIFDPSKYGIGSFKLFYVMNGSKLGIPPIGDWKTQYYNVDNGKVENFVSGIADVGCQGTVDTTLGICLTEKESLCKEGYTAVKNPQGLYDCVYYPPLQICKPLTIDLQKGTCISIEDKETGLPACPDNMFRKISADGKNVICEAQLTEDTLSSEIKIDKAIESAKKLKFIYLGIIGIVILLISAVLIRKKG